MSDDNQIIKVQGDALPVEDFDSEFLIRGFIADTQNLLPKTKLRYEKSLRQYFGWVKKSGYNIKTITLTEILLYKKHLEERDASPGRKLSTFTISTYLVSVRLFYEWANAKGLMFNPAKSLKSPKKEHKFRRKPLTEEQIEQLFDYFKERSRRDYAIAKTMYYCALRTIEVSRINWGDIKMLNNERVVWVMGKGKTEKDAWVKLKDKAFGPILEYLKERKEVKNDDPLFLSEPAIGNPGRLHESTVSRIIKSGLVGIGLIDRDYTAHGIRHSAATNAILNGASISMVQEMLRHKDEKTTLAYIYSVKDAQRIKNKSAEDFL